MPYFCCPAPLQNSYDDQYLHSIIGISQRYPGDLCIWSILNYESLCPCFHIAFPHSQKLHLKLETVLLVFFEASILHNFPTSSTPLKNIVNSCPIHAVLLVSPVKLSEQYDACSLGHPACPSILDPGSNLPWNSWRNPYGRVFRLAKLWVWPLHLLCTMCSRCK